MRVKILVSLLLVASIAFVAMGANTNNQRGVADQAYTFLSEYPTDGNYYFVDNQSTNAQDAGISHGGNWDRPFNTIDYAIGQCDTDNGDIIFVAPNHQEIINAEPEIDLDVRGVRLVGLGLGPARPTLTYAGATYEPLIEVAASNTSIENFIIDMSVLTGLTIPSGISVASTCTGFVFSGNKVIGSSSDGGEQETGGHASYCIYLSGGTNAEIFNNEFIARHAAASAISAFILVGSEVDNVNIHDNYFSGYAHSAHQSNQGALVSGLSCTGVSDFRLTDCQFFLANTGSSPFYFPSSSEGIAHRVVSIGGTITGNTEINFMPIDLFNNIAN